MTGTPGGSNETPFLHPGRYEEPIAALPAYPSQKKVKAVLGEIKYFYFICPVGHRNK